MKSLETNFTKDSHNFSQIKRNTKAALYKRETLEGAFVSYEVFGIMVKNGSEIYPNQTAVVQKWCYCPVSEDRANLWFDRFTNGDVILPHVDPETGESIEIADNRSLDELPDVDGTMTIEPVAEVKIPLDIDPTNPNPEPEPVVEVPVDTVIPTVDVPTVEITPDGGAVVTVAKVRQNKVYPTMILPTGEFTRTQFAILNNLKPANSESYGALIREVKAGRVVEVRKDNSGKGKAKSIYSMVVATPAV